MRLMFILLLCASSYASAGMQIFELKYQMPEELVHTINQQFGERVRASAYGNQLVVNAPASMDADVKQLIQLLDKPVEQLMLQVRVKDQIKTSDSRVQTSGQYCKEGVCIGNTGTRLGSTSQSGANIAILNQQSSRQSSGIQKVRAISGRPALITSGQLVPVTTQTGNHIIRRYPINSSQHPHETIYTGTQTQYHNVEKGFYVTPRVQGNQVRLQVTLNNDSVNRSEKRGLSAAAPTIDTQQVVTSIDGRLNEWISLGDQQQNSNSAQNGFINVDRATRQRLSQYEIYVERIGAR